MSSSKIIVVVDPVKNPRGIPHFEAKNFKSKKIDSVSEYQAIYRKWPFQKPRTSIRPKSNKYEVAATMKSDTTYKMDYAPPKVTLTGREKKEKKKLKENEQYKYLQDEITTREKTYRKTTYASDFCPKEVKRRKPFTCVGEQSFKPPDYKFSCQSMYQLSYLTYSPDVIKKCRPNMIIPPSMLHSNVDRLLSKTCPNQEEKSKDKPEQKPSQPKIKSSIPPPEEDVTTNKKTPEKDTSQVADPKKGEMISTFMADYKANWNVKKRTLCKPEETNYRDDSIKFDGTTTQNQEYKAWTVSKPEVPLWGRKPVYKQPMEGMALNSTYSMDYDDPKVIVAAASMKPPPREENIIKASGDGKEFKPSSTYNNTFKEWRGAQPAKTFLVKSQYNPPRDKMEFESTHRKCYTGQLAQKAEIIRHSSEHRQLNKDGQFYFQTTYNATYKDHRPKSCPGTGRGKIPVAVKTAWQEDLSSKKELNESHDSGIDMIECEN